VNGSTNRISLEQIEAAVQGGMSRIFLEARQLLDRGQERRGEAGPAAEMNARSQDSLLRSIEGILDSGRNLILQPDPGSEVSGRFQELAKALGRLVGGILRSRSDLTPVVFGGDTALGLVECLGAVNLQPIDQIAPGVVVSRIMGDSLEMPLITKAGGFGPPGIIEEIRAFVGFAPAATSGS
jgi:uncharacterized protein YgbK (DUF1537 family)